MELQMKPIRYSRGSVLLAVLIVAAVGLMFGAGSLLLFRYQCQLRIERQHEFEKIYAVRSALNFVRTADSLSLGGNTRRFRYQTGSGRNLGLVVKPVDPIFPNVTNVSHLVMESAVESRRFKLSGPDQCKDYPDYEYGSEGVTNLAIAGTNGKGAFGLAFNDLSVTNKSARWWVNVGMRNTGGWLQEDFGRRYYFIPESFVGQTSSTGDIMRLCIIRNVTNENETIGRRHGWPLSQEKERALVFQVQPIAGGAIKGLFECVYTNGMVMTRSLLPMNWFDEHFQCPLGLQIAGDKVTMFYIDLGGVTVGYGDPTWFGYNFYPPHPGFAQMSIDTYKYFAEPQEIGGKWYGGMITNEYGKVEAPELRAVFEVVAAASERAESNIDFLTQFKVTPAYQYDIFLEHPFGVTNRATVAQIIGKYDDEGLLHTVMTYDTHGTENKGFRKDEREAERKRNGR